MILVNKIAQVEDCSPIRAVLFFCQQTRKVTFLETRTEIPYVIDTRFF